MVEFRRNDVSRTPKGFRAIQKLPYYLVFIMLQCFDKMDVAFTEGFNLALYGV